MQGLASHPITCPYCGERYETVIDHSQLDIEYTEDCYVCCRPIVLTVRSDQCDTTIIDTRREDD